MLNRLRSAPPGPRQRAALHSGLAGHVKRLQDRQWILPLVQAYVRAKRERGVVDFADQMQIAATLVRDHPRIAAASRDRYRVVLLDEYQDTGHAQRVILRTLFGDRDGTGAVDADRGGSDAGGRGPGRTGHPVTAVGDPGPVHLLVARGVGLQPAPVRHRLSAGLGAAVRGPAAADQLPEPGRGAGAGQRGLPAGPPGRPRRSRWGSCDRCRPPRRAGSGTACSARRLRRTRGWPGRLPGTGGRRWTGRVARIGAADHRGPGPATQRHGRHRRRVAGRGSPGGGGRPRRAARRAGGRRSGRHVAGAGRSNRRPGGDAAADRRPLATGRGRPGGAGPARPRAGRSGRPPGRAPPRPRPIRPVDEPAATVATAAVRSAVAAALPVEDIDTWSLVDAAADLGPADGLLARGSPAARTVRRSAGPAAGRLHQPLPDLVADLERACLLDVEALVAGDAGRAHLDAFAAVVAEVAATGAGPGELLEYLDAAAEREDGLTSGRGAPVLRSGPGPDRARGQGTGMGDRRRAAPDRRGLPDHPGQHLAGGSGPAASADPGRPGRPAAADAARRRHPEGSRRCPGRRTPPTSPSSG